jgi:hypothetical protein
MLNAKHKKEKLKRMRQQRRGKFAEKISTMFSDFTGHDINSLSSFHNFASTMSTDVDGASLGICRMLFGE